MPEQKNRNKFESGNKVKLIDNFENLMLFKILDERNKNRIIKARQKELRIYHCTSGICLCFDKEGDYVQIPSALLKSDLQERLKDYYVGWDEMTPWTEAYYNVLVKKATYFLNQEVNKRIYTYPEIQEAQRIIGEIVAGFRWGEGFVVVDRSERELTIHYTSRSLDSFHTFTAKCSPNDKFDKTIGTMVALCKATSRDLPEFVRH